MKPDNNPPDKKPSKEVTITINGVAYDVRPGTHPVAELKTIPNPNIPNGDVLCVLMDGEPKPLGQNDRIDIKGGEIFASHCPTGGAS